jgi:glycosyltransferase involved in cell wall biosynthesis
MNEALSQLRVLQVVPELDTGGVEQTVLDMAQAITTHGGTAFVASKGGRLADKLAQTGAHVFNVPVHSKNPLQQIANIWRLRKIIIRKQINIIHVRSRAPALACLIAARLCGIASVSTYHGIYNAKSGLKRWYNGLMTKTDRVIANSDYTRNHILVTYPHLAADRLVSIPRGIDLERFDPDAINQPRIAALQSAWGISGDEKRKIFMLAGRLTRWKGQALIIEAASLLKSSGCSDFLILFVGDDQGRSAYRDELLSAIAAHGLSEHIKLVGHCHDMPAAFSLCDFALAPSIEPEAFGRTAVEPQAMRKPVLAAAHGATVETVVDNMTGWLITPGDVAAWAQALRHAIELKAPDYLAMGEKGQARVRALFSLKTMCASTLRLYRSLLDKTGS